MTLFFTSLNLTLFPDLIDAGLAGLAINYSNMATGCLQQFISVCGWAGVKRLSTQSCMLSECTKSDGPAARSRSPSSSSR